MNEAQRLLKLQFPKIKGLQLTLLPQKHSNRNIGHQFIKNQLQIIPQQVRPANTEAVI